MPKRDLSEVLARWRADADVLELHGQRAAANLLRGYANEIATSAEEFIIWLSEADAMMRSGHAASWLRVRRAEWQRQGHARFLSRGVWEYRSCIIPRRKSIPAIDAAAARGRAAAERATRTPPMA